MPLQRTVCAGLLALAEARPAGNKDALADNDWAGGSWARQSQFPLQIPSVAPPYRRLCVGGDSRAVRSAKLGPVCAESPMNGEEPNREPQREGATHNLFHARNLAE